MPFLSASRFVAPHFIEIEGSSDVAGAVRRACAFTTHAPGHPANGEGATHYHRCLLISGTGDWREDSATGWRTESWAVGGQAVPSMLAPATAPLVREGRADDLMQAIAAALGAAYTRPPGTVEEGPIRCVAPSFVAIQREAGLPRVWACSHLCTMGRAPAEQSWTHLKTIYVREWPSRLTQGGYQCEMEVLPSAAILPAGMEGPEAARMSQCWWAMSPEAAMRSAIGRLSAPRRRSRRLDHGSNK